MIAFHMDNSPWTKRWIAVCDKKGYEYVIVNLFETDIISQLKKKNVSAILAHPVLSDYRTLLFTKSILNSIEKAGIKTFPNMNAFWHYNDKLAQKYIFEALDIPHIPTFAFYDKKEACTWLEKADYPIVFKLRGGASSSNVFLIHNKQEGKKFLRKMFKSGYKPIRSVFSDISTKAKIHNKDRDWIRTLMRFPVTIQHTMALRNLLPAEKRYFLVQKFLPGNTFDTRVFVMGSKAIASRRFVRPNDFRASGTGSLNADNDQKKIDRRAVCLAFNASRKLGSFSMAYDIIYDEDKNPVIVEMSYTMPTHDEGIRNIEGYWDDSVNFHKDRIRCEDFILFNLLEKGN